MSLIDPIPDKKYSYADLQKWPDDGRQWELIDGVPFCISGPAIRVEGAEGNPLTPQDMSGPSTRHQFISGNLYFELRSFLSGKPCKVLYAPCDVKFADIGSTADEDVFTVVQPDLVVVCDPSKIDEKSILGAPDLLVEILSDSTSARDQNEKFRLYERQGVQEYWVVNPWDNSVAVHRLASDGRFEPPVAFNIHDHLTTPLFPGLSIPLAAVLAE